MALPLHEHELATLVKSVWDRVAKEVQAETDARLRKDLHLRWQRGVYPRYTKPQQLAGVGTIKAEGERIARLSVSEVLQALRGTSVTSAQLVAGLIGPFRERVGVWAAERRSYVLRRERSGRVWDQSDAIVSAAMGAIVRELEAEAAKLRVQEHSRVLEKRPTGEKCRVLFLAANPRDRAMEQLALDEEAREIQQKIDAAKYRDSLELVTRWATRPADLLQYLNQYRPQVVHFSAHGSQHEEIILQDDMGQSKPVSKCALKQLFETLKDNVRVVVLNACFSRPQAETLVEVVDCAIGVKGAIGNGAARKFAGSFYQGIGFGRSVLEAFEQGKTTLMLGEIGDDNAPELLVRAGIDARDVFLIKPDELAPNA